MQNVLFFSLIFLIKIINYRPTFCKGKKKSKFAYKNVSSER